MWVKTHALRSFISSVWKREILNKDSAMVGRWGFPKSDSEMEIKVKQNNEDHCGACVDPPTEKSPSKVSHPS